MKQKKSSVLLRRSCLCRHSFRQTLKLYFYHFWFMRCNVHLFHLSILESRVLLQSERLERDCGDVTRDIKSSTPPPPCLIDKIFGFSLPLSSLLLFFSHLSLPLSSFILCIFGIERQGEKERESVCEKKPKKNQGTTRRRAQERVRDSFGVKGEVDCLLLLPPL